MKKKKRILYAIQGTGNGHVARAREIIPILLKYGDLDILLSGDQSQVDLGHPIKYQAKGLTFLYSSTGAIDYIRTIFKNNIFRLLHSIMTLPIQDYDLIINDFEFTSAWACKLRGKSCYGLGHQMSFRSAQVPRPAKRSWLGEFILRRYAPIEEGIGFHFRAFDEGIAPPVIRSEVRQQLVENKGHYTVYLPAFGIKEVCSFLNQFPETDFEVFTKYVSEKEVQENVRLLPVHNDSFLKSLSSGSGMLCSAGFEGPSEALFLGKKLIVIPIRGQYEQACNAAALKELGIEVMESLDTAVFSNWLHNDHSARLKFPDATEELMRESILKPAGFI